MTEGLGVTREEGEKQGRKQRKERFAVRKKDHRKERKVKKRNVTE